MGEYWASPRGRPEGCLTPSLADSAGVGLNLCSFWGEGEEMGPWGEGGHRALLVSCRPWDPSLGKLVKLP
jgi:hypothetical protein